jgi:hypothetical protein
MWLRGDADFTGNALFWAQGGGRGGAGIASADSDVTATSGAGGDGGTIELFVTGFITFSGGENIMRSGSGGDAGDATATALPNQAGDKAPGATATTGDGGMPGLVDIRAGREVNIDDAGALVVEIGFPGGAGTATANGADGRDAQDATTPAQEGGDATATGGNGGGTPDEQLLRRGQVTGEEPVFRGLDDGRPNGGGGGRARASAGNGGAGTQSNKAGGRGGLSTANGGDGGDALLKDHRNRLLGHGGPGGQARFLMGNGGDGWSDCVPGQPAEAGGAGGNGGSTSGSPGAGGQGLTQGNAGDTRFVTVGNGGDGGNGENPGPGGTKGTQHAVDGDVTQVDPIFTDGATGQSCGAPPPSPTRSIHLPIFPVG